eukprot:TRINITY_DN764_c0_g1_i1.p1 TRINITY_DN764_c0_g1~~TRINITY_DN764_c0_g1_i1.p1  ORF type:complete len:141 (+),score=37.29 TRINITY_DN764_c0_g1_i1:4-426(+)
MKTHSNISSSRRKSRRAHFTAPSHIRHRLMAAPLSKELRTEHKVRSMPIKKDDEVLVVRGKNATVKGKVSQVYRLRWCIYIEKLTKTKKNGTPIKVPIHPSNVVITKLNISKDRTKLLTAKRNGLDSEKNKGKVQANEVQ